MKKNITIALMTLASFLGAQETIPETTVPRLVSLAKLDEKVSPKKSFGYVRMAVSDSELPKDIDGVIPGIGLGYRLLSGATAFDLSAAYNHREVRTDEGKDRTFFYTVPKVNCFYYISSLKNNSLYAGGGLAWGGMQTKDAKEFHGIIPNISLGFEMNRNAAWRSFVQLDVSQPAIAVVQKNGIPGPFAEFSVGAGF